MEKLKRLLNIAVNYLKNMKLNQMLIWLVFIFGGIAVFLAFQLSNTKRQLEIQRNLIASLNNETQIWRDKDSLIHAKVEIIQTETVKEFLVIKAMDENIKQLQNEVKKFKKYLNNSGSVTNISSNTNIDTVFPTIIKVRDTIRTKDTIKIFPEYTSTFNLKDYVFGNIKATKDNTSIHLKIKNDYSIILGEESQGFFKKPKTFAEVINKNPYSDLLNVKTFQIIPKSVKRFGIGPVVGGGFDQDWKFQPFIGIGFQYSLINF